MIHGHKEQNQERNKKNFSFLQKLVCLKLILLFSFFSNYRYSTTPWCWYWSSRVPLVALVNCLSSGCPHTTTGSSAAPLRPLRMLQMLCLNVSLLWRRLWSRGMFRPVLPGTRQVLGILLPLLLFRWRRMRRVSRRRLYRFVIVNSWDSLLRLLS